MNSWVLLPIADGALRRTFEFGRIRSNSDWILPILACVAILLVVRIIYRRDAYKLPRTLGFLLTVLRSVVFFALLMFFLQPQWRCEREVVRNSQCLLLVDTSSSMALDDPPTGESGELGTRLERVRAALAAGELVPNLRHTHDTLIQTFDVETAEIANLPKETDSASPTEQPPWAAALKPIGLETRLGDALVEAIRHRAGEPLSGIVVFSDGGQNAGVLPPSAIAMALEAGIPIHTVGLGAVQRPANVTVYRLDAISRAYPGDPFTVSGVIQSRGAGLAGRSVTVELLQRDGGQDAAGTVPGSGTAIGSERIILGTDGESVPVKFEVTPRETGLRTLCLRVRPPADDGNAEDDFLETEVDVVDRKDRVLLVAGGPTREYHFLRTLLFRDVSMTLDIYLQTAQPGMSQEADRILDDFPVTREEMYAYDCVVAFDPNWRALSASQIDLLESWVAEQGGGLVVIAGPVYTGEPVGGWVQDRDMQKIRDLYPVEFSRHVAVWDVETLTAAEPWPLDFTREGMEAEFLWLGETATASQQVWAEFKGVFSHQPLRGAKPAATVYAHFSDPRIAQGGDRPIFLAAQFYGSGRVFYIGSGELWRLRALDPGHFERLYTRLIRHVSQGRLLRQSSRGMLLVGQDRYSVGSTVELRAQVTDARFAPLEAPTVELEAYLPDGSVRIVELQHDPARAGAYLGTLTVLEEGTHRLELPIPGSDERIVRRIRVLVPDLERESPEQNVALLRRLAEETGGTYYADLAKAVDPVDPESIVNQLTDRTRTVVLAATPDRLWTGRHLLWLMVGLCCLLCLEWLIRRLARLA
jgi:hypothetical protein